MPVDNFPTEAGLSWAVKASFQDYVAARPEGSIVPSGGARIEGRSFFFPLDAVEREDDGRIRKLQFQGSITLSAHDGYLSVSIADPVICVEENSARIWIRSPGAPTSATPSNYLLAEATPITLHDNDGEWERIEILEPLLSTNAVTLFDNVYPYRTPLEPLRARTPSMANSNPDRPVSRIRPA
ncbi:hypothetical protein CH298_28060 [Rhodococcoides fascians]|uniref:HtaA domain-containing protein n=1 Tax=Rhodococcoides fascians TaxID=1828 RepID=UPI000B9A2DC5|nr:HtaA domain-containing protein [Rhodococcus fascians]OZD68991.1 hypothetical protein CH263_08915 [Rhodococcus sp. 06-1059B-a]OZE81076.1 hypothetical protein CH303_27800 [Rhodococcus fascians]OZF08330.1 hypothetical protein CH298_28060 [Rhodococcus fascians]OZF12334.1 hypothetical protein CH297_27820 [Rhodococcus fascians]OZF59086.1 hypothetical protein CH308_28075 [Rhodococcus fascians]